MLCAAALHALVAIGCGGSSASSSADASTGLDTGVTGDLAIGAGEDAASKNDLAFNLAPDLAVVPDLAGPADLARLPDLTFRPSVGCGAPSGAAIKAYQACANAADKATCLANGGDWRNIFNIPNGPMACYCLTGQVACPCQQNIECVGGCQIGPDPVTGCNPPPKSGVCAESSIESVCVCIGPDPVCP